MFKNKHFVVALLIAPILSILAYVATDMAVSEPPQVAKEGETYQLVSQSNCRYTSGLCDMKNGDFKIKFRSEKLTATDLELSLHAAYPLQGVKVSLVDQQGDDQLPIDMQPRNPSEQDWHIRLPAPLSSESWLRVAVQSQGTLYYGQTQTTFVKYETLLSDQ
ncbi:hypothetical protein ACODM8_07490 [Vibrio ostreicida]|uniref:hypothetical protein n=1 Tax=Vibrio ostreicida TaxID=526588 RepID=UPI003B596FCB